MSVLTALAQRLKKNKTSFAFVLRIKEARCKANPKNLDAGERAVFDALMENGVTVLPGFFSAAQSESLIKNFEQHRHLAQWVDNDSRLWGAEKLSAEHQNAFALNPFFRKIGESYVGDELVFQTTMAAKLTAEPKGAGSGGGWHRDSFSKQFKIMAYLSDVDSEHGPFEYISKSHTFSNILSDLKNSKRSGDANNARYSDEQAEEIRKMCNGKVMTLTAKKGAVILFDPRGVHRGAPIKTGIRYAVTNYYVAKSYSQKNTEIERLVNYK